MLWCSWTRLGLLEFLVFHCLPNSAWADGNLAEVAGQLSKMGGTPNSKSTQPRSKSTWDTLYRVYLRVRIIFTQMCFILSSIIKDFKAETRKRPPPTRHRSPGESVRPSVRLTTSNGVLPAHSPLLHIHIFRFHNIKVHIA